MAPGTPRNLLSHLCYRYKYMCLLQGMIDCVIKKSRIWFFVTKILNRWMNISLSTNQFKWKRFKCKDKVVLCLSLKSSSLLNKVVKGISPSLYTTGKRAEKNNWADKYVPFLEIIWENGLRQKANRPNTFLWNHFRLQQIHFLSHV